MKCYMYTRHQKQAVTSRMGVCKGLLGQLRCMMPCCCTGRLKAVKQTKEKAVNSLLVVDSVDNILIQPQNHICEKDAVLDKVLDLCRWDAGQPQLAIAECKAMPRLTVLALARLKVFNSCGECKSPQLAV